MALLKRFFCVTGLIVGGLGVFVCAALVAGVWIADAQLCHATRGVCEKLDGTLSRVSDRAQRAEQRLDEASMAVGDVYGVLGKIAKQQAVDRLRLRFEVGGKAERLAGMLDQADTWMETSEASIELVRRATDAANRAGAALDTSSLDRLQKEVESLRSDLQRAGSFVDRIRDDAGREDEEAAVRQRVEQAAALALQVIVALDLVKARMPIFKAKISEAKRELDFIESRLLAWIHTTATVLTLVLLWMLAGQLALCHSAWWGFRR